MPHSHFGEFDCDFTANQFAAQSERIRSSVSAESHSMANPLRMRCKLVSTNVEQKKIFIFILRKQVKLKKKALFRRLIKLSTSDEAINFSESFNLAANKKHERYRKNQNQKEK